MSIRGIDLFCGGGGSSVGARSAGISMVGAVDAWPIATAIYADNFPDAKRNVVTRTLSDRSDGSIFSRLSNADVLIASPECTNHSVARGAKPTCAESQRSAWYVMKILEDLCPRYLVIENVTRMRRWNGFSEFCRTLNRRFGFNINMQILDAADFGVPQNRRRLFLLCDRRDLPRDVAPTTKRHKPASKILAPTDRYDWTPLYTERRARGTLERAERAIDALGRKKDFLLVYYGSDAAGGWQPVDRPLRTLTTLDRFAIVRWFGNEPMMRMLQVSELRLAMGFPSSFILGHGTRRDQIRILGNGVCPPVMQQVIGTLLGTDTPVEYAA